MTAASALHKKAMKKLKAAIKAAASGADLEQSASASEKAEADVDPLVEVD